MARMIIAERLKLMRERRDLSQKGLAAKARLNKQTIYRREREDGPMRDANLERMARALDVDPEVLTDKKLIPPDAKEPGAPPDETDSQLNVRVDAAARNAFVLVARRYGVSVQKIVQLAPLFFVILVEASLREWGKRCDEVEDAVRQMESRLEELRRKAPYLERGRCIDEDGDDYQEGSIKYQRERIEWREVFDPPLTNRGSDTPLTVYLRGLAEGADDINIRALDRSSTKYEICRAEAMELAGGDAEVAGWLLNGEVPLHKMRRGLKTVEERVEWIRDHRIPVREVPEEKPGQLPGDLDLSDLPDLEP